MKVYSKLVMRMLAFVMALGLVFSIMPITRVTAEAGPLVFIVDKSDLGTITPGTTIEIPIYISANPVGVSAIADVRIDLGPGLTLAFPYGHAGHDPDEEETWPFKANTFVPTGAAAANHMIPLAGSPSAAAISYNHVVMQFMRMVPASINHVVTGMLATLFVDVAATAGPVLYIDVTVAGASRRTGTGADIGTEPVPVQAPGRVYLTDPGEPAPTPLNLADETQRLALISAFNVDTVIWAYFVGTGWRVWDIGLPGTLGNPTQFAFSQ